MLYFSKITTTSRKENGKYRNPNYCLLLNRSSIVIVHSRRNAKGGMAPRFLHQEHILVMVVPARSCSLTADSGRVEFSARKRERERGDREGREGRERFVQGYEANPRILTEVKG